MTARAVFLDRDGVVLEAVERDGVPEPAPAADAVVLPGAFEAVAMLCRAGYHVLIVTNQPDIARGRLSRSEVDAANARLQAAIPGIEEVRVCPHDDDDDCPCRKPRPGLLVAPGTHGPWDLVESYMIGDRWRDIDAGRAAGCRTVFIDHGYAETRPAKFDHKVSSLLEAAVWILSRSR